MKSSFWQRLLKAEFQDDAYPECSFKLCMPQEAQTKCCYPSLGGGSLCTGSAVLEHSPRAAASPPPPWCNSEVRRRHVFAAPRAVHQSFGCEGLVVLLILRESAQFNELD